MIRKRPMPRPPFASKQDLVYSTLRQRIVDGKLAAGARLVIDSLAREFEVSAIPVREALRRLTSEGFVEFKTHIGARVAAVGPEQVEEVFSLLEALEVISGRAACARITPLLLRELADQVERMDRLMDRHAQWSELNLQFHRTICSIAEYQLTDALFERVQTHWERIRRSFLKGVFLGHLEQAQREHWLILKALEKGNADRYEAIIRRHNQSARAAYLKQFGLGEKE